MIFPVWFSDNYVYDKIQQLQFIEVASSSSDKEA